MPFDDVSLERRFGTIESDISGLKEAARRSNDWQEVSRGFHQKMNTFVDRFEAREEEREKIQQERHLENTQTLSKISNKINQKSLLINIASVAVAVAALMVGILAIIVTVKLSHQTRLNFFNLFPAKISGPEYAGAVGQETAAP